MKTETQHLSWWKGRRGEWYVVIQVILIFLVFLGPRSSGLLPLWNLPYRGIVSALGVVLLVLGSLLLLVSLLKLGKNLTPVPYPKEQSELVMNGTYKLVRHPIYFGGILMVFGWALFVQSTLTLIYAIMLFVLFDFKSRREERWLSEKFPGYGEYQKRVRRLIPFIY